MRVASGLPSRLPTEFLNNLALSGKRGHDSGICFHARSVPTTIEAVSLRQLEDRFDFDARSER